jgi:hypothetical protein
LRARAWPQTPSATTHSIWSGRCYAAHLADFFCPFTYLSLVIIQASNESFEDAAWTFQLPRLQSRPHAAARRF